MINFDPSNLKQLAKSLKNNVDIHVDLSKKLNKELNPLMEQLSDSDKIKLDNDLKKQGYSLSDIDKNMKEVSRQMQNLKKKEF